MPWKPRRPWRPGRSLSEEVGSSPPLPVQAMHRCYIGRSTHLWFTASHRRRHSAVMRR
jgi:hypothetical protein